MVVVVGVVVLVVGAVALVLDVVVLVVVVEAADVLTVSTAVDVEVASGLVVDETSAGTVALLVAPDDPGALTPSAGSELPALQPATAANRTTSRKADARTNRR